MPNPEKKPPVESDHKGGALEHASKEAQHAGEKLRQEAHDLGKEAWKVAKKGVEAVATGILPTIAIHEGPLAAGVAQKAAEFAASHMAGAVKEGAKKLGQAAAEVINDAKTRPLQTAAELAAGGVIGGPVIVTADHYIRKAAKH